MYMSYYFVLVIVVMVPFVTRSAYITDNHHSIVQESTRSNWQEPTIKTITRDIVSSYIATGICYYLNKKTFDHADFVIAKTMLRFSSHSIINIIATNPQLPLLLTKNSSGIEMYSLIVYNISHPMVILKAMNNLSEQLPVLQDTHHERSLAPALYAMLSNPKIQRYRYWSIKNFSPAASENLQKTLAYLYAQNTSTSNRNEKSWRTIILPLITNAKAQQILNTVTKHKYTSSVNPAMYIKRKVF